MLQSRIPVLILELILTTKGVFLLRHYADILWHWQHCVKILYSFNLFESRLIPYRVNTFSNEKFSSCNLKAILLSLVSNHPWWALTNNSKHKMLLSSSLKIFLHSAHSLTAGIIGHGYNVDIQHFLCGLMHTLMLTLILTVTTCLIFLLFYYTSESQTTSSKVVSVFDVNS